MPHLPGARQLDSSAGELLVNQVIRDVAGNNILKEAQHWAVTFIYRSAVKHIILHKP